MLYINLIILVPIEATLSPKTYGRYLGDVNMNSADEETVMVTMDKEPRFVINVYC